MFKTNAHGPSPQPTGLQHAVLRPQQDVTRPKTRFKPTLHNKCGLDGGAIRWQHILVRYFNPNPVLKVLMGPRQDVNMYPHQVVIQHS